jgi:hypothetical protein
MMLKCNKHLVLRDVDMALLNRHCTLQEWCMVCSHFWEAKYLVLCVFESMSSYSLLVLRMCKLPSAVKAELKEGTSTIWPHWQRCCWSTNSNIRGPSSCPVLHQHEGYFWRIEATNTRVFLFGFFLVRKFDKNEASKV